MNGSEMYTKSYEGVLALLADAQFDSVREKYDKILAEEDDDDEDVLVN